MGISHEEIEYLIDKDFARILPNDNRYAVSRDGRYFSRAKHGRTSSFDNWHQNKPILSRKPGSKRIPYLQVSIGGSKSVELHKLVAETFLGPRQSGQVIRHLDGNSLNNVIENLAYGSYSDNQKDCRKHGRLPMGEKKFNAKYDRWQILIAKDMRASGYKVVRISEKLGILEKYLSKVFNQGTWAWLERK